MSAEIVFAAYRPHEGREEEFLSLLKGHVPTLRRLELATGRAPIVAKAKDGTIIEIFEWASAEAAPAAHEHPEVGRIWEAMGAVSEFTTIGSLEEVGKPFPHFTPVDLA